MLIDFLKTDLDKTKLANALEVLNAFKACESEAEWAMIPFDCWIKLEQLEEYLEHLVNGIELKEDTLAQIRYRS